MNGCSVEQGFKCSAKRCFHLQVEDASMASDDRLVMKLLRSRGPLLVPIETNGGGIGRRMIPVQTRSKGTTWMIRVNFTDRCNVSQLLEVVAGSRCAALAPRSVSWKPGIPHQATQLEHTATDLAVCLERIQESILALATRTTRGQWSSVAEPKTTVERSTASPLPLRTRKHIHLSCRYVCMYIYIYTYIHTM